MGFLLRCFQQLSAPHMATQRLPLERQLVNYRCVPPGPLVLGRNSFNTLTIILDMDRTVSRILFSCFQEYGLYLHPLFQLMNLKWSWHIIHILTKTCISIITISVSTGNYESSFKRISLTTDAVIVRFLESFKIAIRSICSQSFTKL